MKVEIKQALEKATPGPWKVDYAILSNVSKNGITLATVANWDNAHLIANAPEWLRWQNEQIERLEKALEDTRIGIGNAYEFGYLRETDEGDVQKMLDRINKALEGKA